MPPVATACCAASDRAETAASERMECVARSAASTLPPSVADARSEALRVGSIELKDVAAAAGASGMTGRDGLERLLHQLLAEECTACSEDDAITDADAEMQRSGNACSAVMARRGRVR